MPVRVRPGVPYGSVAQSAERLAVNQDVAGSSPAGIAIAIFRRLCRWDASRRRCTWPAWMHPSVPYVEEGLEVLAWRRVRRRYQAAGNCDIWNSVVLVAGLLGKQVSPLGDCRFEPCLFRHHNTVFGPSWLIKSNPRAFPKWAKDCISTWSNVIIGSQPVSKAGVPQGIAGSSPACSARYAAVAIMERARQNGCRS